MTEITADQARLLMNFEHEDEIMDLVFNGIRQQARANRNFAILVDNIVPGASKWGKLCEEWSGMGVVTEFKTDAQPVVDRLKKLGYRINFAHSPADGPHPEWYGIRVEW